MRAILPGGARGLRAHVRVGGLATFLTLGALLVGCAPSQARTFESRAEAPRCTSYKVGEVSGVSARDLNRVRRRMDGDFSRTRQDTPTSSTFTIEVFRYHDRSCAENRR